jgi:putative ABC transport system permease protein
VIRFDDVLRLVFLTLSEKKVRSTLTIMGIAIGPAAMITIVGTTQGYSNTIIESLSSLGQNIIAVLPEKGYRLTDNTVNTLKSLSWVKEAIPFYNTQGIMQRSDGSQIAASIYMTDLNTLFRITGSFEIKEGNIPPSTSYISGVFGYEISHKDGRRLVSLGDAVTVKIGLVREEKLEVKTVTIKAAGLLNKYGSALVLNPDTTIFMPLQAGRSLFSMSDYSGILVVAVSENYVGRVVDQIKDRYRDVVSVFAFQQIANIVNSVVQTLNFLLFALSSAAFTVAITGTMATMLTSVIERTREIGVLKAMGYSSLTILMLIAVESLMMSILGGATGAVIGAVGAYALSSSGSFTLRGVGGSLSIKAAPLITVDLVLRALGMAVLVGVVGGLIPAYRASRIQPLAALKYE